MKILEEEYFSLLTSVGDATDEALTRELESKRPILMRPLVKLTTENTGTTSETPHMKTPQVMADENFRAEIIQYIRENGYVKGEPNLTSLNICSWVKENTYVHHCIKCMDNEPVPDIKVSQEVLGLLWTSQGVLLGES